VLARQPEHPLHSGDAEQPDQVLESILLIPFRPKFTDKT
jgi:hypothetical protein